MNLLAKRREFTRLWLYCDDALGFEIQQIIDEGRDVPAAQIEEAKALMAMPHSPERLAQATALYEALQCCDYKNNFPYKEPNIFSEIQALRPKNHQQYGKKAYKKEDTYDKIHGGWLGRTIGCLLGQPVEMWHLPRLRGFLKETNNFPIRHYLRSDVSEDIRKRYDVLDEGFVYGSTKVNWLNQLEDFAPEDDDTNYTVMGLEIIKTYGKAFTPEDVCESWSLLLPYSLACTAERVAYQNFAKGIFPPYSASTNNPYREWIGAQIRADFFGYISLGDPADAARMAFNDGSISHVKNGIYGEMFVAAMIAQAGVSEDLMDIVQAGLSQIPETSRLFEKIQQVCNDFNNGLSFEEMVTKIHQQYDETNFHHWCHTIPNAMVVTAALLYSEHNFEKGITHAVEAAFDTDCNGATVGSILGVLLGAKNIPQSWSAPLHDRLKSRILDRGYAEISALAKETVEWL